MKNIPELPDNDLVTEIIAGNQRALEALMARHGSLLKGVAMHALDDEFDANETCNDVFLHFYQNASNFDPGKGELLGWLIIITRRRSLDRVRRRWAYQRARDRFEERAKWQTADRSWQAANAFAELLDTKDMWRQLSARLDILPPDQAIVLRLTFFEGKSQRQIADLLNLPLGTVKTRIELGTRKLQEGYRRPQASNHDDSHSELSALEDEDLDDEVPEEE